MHDDLVLIIHINTLDTASAAAWNQTFNELGSHIPHNCKGLAGHSISMFLKLLFALFLLSNLVFYRVCKGEALCEVLPLGG